MIDIQLTHRALMYLAAIAVLAMFAVAIRRGVRSRAFPLAVASCSWPRSCSAR